MQIACERIVSVGRNRHYQAYALAANIQVHMAVDDD